MPAALVRLFQTEFNKSFHQIFNIHIPVRWPQFTPLIKTLTTGHFLPGTVTMSGNFRPNIPTALTAQWTAAPPHKTLALAQ